MLDPFVDRLFRRVDQARGSGSDMAAHMMTLYALARLQSFGPLVECGVHRGFSTHALLCGAIDKGGHLTSYDIQPNCATWASQEMGLTMDDPKRSHWTFVHKASIEAAKEWKDGSVALFFLDTSHDFASTKAELEAWLPRMHPDGIMCGHDYYIHLDPVYRDANLGVGPAVDAFVKAHKDRLRLQVFKYDQGLFVLWPKKAG